MNLLEDIWYTIYKQLPIVDFYSKVEVPIPSQSAYRAFTNLANERITQTKCMMCGGECQTHICDEDGCNDGLLGYLYCITCEGYYVNKAKWAICLTCETYHNICACGKYCRLTSHGGWFIDKYDETYNESTSITNFRLYDEYDDTYVLPKESKIRHASLKIILPTGPDGGYTHTWTCDNTDCKEHGVEYNYTDK